MHLQEKLMNIAKSNIAAPLSQKEINIISPISNDKKFFIETFGCQMNFSDTEIVKSIMIDNCFTVAQNMREADIIFINTCAIRENAEERVYKRLKEVTHLKKNNPDLLIGILGCMSERSKHKFDKNLVDIFAGPDNYRELPKLVKSAQDGIQGINAKLSPKETYEDLIPYRSDKSSISAFISIMRGCNNYCSYCVVPETRGKERCRNPFTIINEATKLYQEGYREITLLGQNVNSYRWSENSASTIEFPDLLKMIALVSPELRVRFTTSHPKDLDIRIIDVIANHNNICNHIHLPVQSGSSRILKLMNRKYTRESYLATIKMAKEFIPEIGLTTDIITGFCTETEDDHRATLHLMEKVRYDFAYMFMYSEREMTFAAENYPDDIDSNIKKDRLSEIINLQNKISLENSRKKIGKTFEVLVDGYSKRSDKMYKGRNSQNITIVFPAERSKIGNYVNVKIEDCTSATLIGKII